MPESSTTDQNSSLYFSISNKDLAEVLLTGLTAGAVTGLLAEVIARFVIKPIFCRSADAFTVCANGGDIAFNTALLVTAMLAVVALVKLGVYRPLLVALAPAACLWGVNAYMGSLSWVEYGFWLVVLMAVAYVLFFWLLRLSNFLLASITTVVAVVLIRLMLLI